MKGTIGFKQALCRRLLFLFLTAGLICILSTGYAQQIAPAARLLQVKNATDSLVLHNPAEKLYLQLDKNTYTPGDTLWFKAYLFHAPTLGLSAKSGIIYVDIATDSNVVVKKLRLPVEQGLSWGNIKLKDLPAGNYTLKAYTNWMRNFNEAGSFYAHFTVADAGGSNWLVNYSSKIITADGADKADVKLMISDFNKVPLTSRNVQLDVMRGKRTLYRKAIETDEHGLINVNFKLSAKLTGLRIAVHDGNGNAINVPLNLEWPRDADVQFMPESGNLIAGLPARVGFKAIGMDGRGIAVTGIVFDSNNQRVTDFSSLHLGIGSFSFQVKSGERYHAIVTLPGGAVKEFALPDVKSSGTLLKVNDVQGSDSVNVTAYATADIVNSAGTYFLIGKSRQTICYAATLSFAEGGHISKNISKKLFPTGITHFILANAKSQTVNERLAFINQHDGIRLNITTDKPVYALHDSIAMRIAVNDILGNPLKSNFSLAVTDDSQVHPDTLNGENIFTRIFLTSELRGYVEQPNYYFGVKNNQSRQALDNLLLTQGWVSYDWPQGKGLTLLPAEDEFAVKGRVINFFNKPVKNTKVSLLSKSPLLATDVYTDSSGHFLFHHFPHIDTPVFVLKTAKNFNVSIQLDDPGPAVFNAPLIPATIPWYASGDTSLLAGVKNNRIRQNLADSLPAGQHVLKEVKITARKIVKGSQNLNGPGNADLVFDEADLEKAGKQNWLQFLEKRVPGFRVSSIHRPLSDKGDPLVIAHYYALKYALQDKNPGDFIAPPSISTGETYSFQWYFINDKPIKLLVDGIRVGEVLKSPNIDEPNFITMKNYLERFDAEDIKGMEIMSTAKYSSKYYVRYTGSAWVRSVNPSDFSYIEITTRSGSGPGISNTAGSYLYKPLALSAPSRFYRPRYLPDNTNKHNPDLRSTIHWEPNITTNADGKATVSFYAADKPSTYTYILEGTNMDGSIGYTYGKIKVTGNTNP